MNRIVLFLILIFLGSPLRAQQPSSTDEEPTPPTSESSGNLMWILPTILALAAGGYAWFVGEAAKRRGRQLEGYVKQMSSRQKKAAGSSSVQAIAPPVIKDDRAVQDLQKRIASLEKELDEMRVQLKRQVSVQERQAPRPQAATSQTHPQTTPAKATPPAQPQQAVPQQPASSVMATVNKATAASQAPAGPQTKWAKYADAGDGFSSSALSDEQDGEKIFELTIQDATTARFRVVSARGPQQMALHDPTFYFSKTCTYDTLPTPQSTISTDSPGTLKLVGNKWAIQQPARIRFS